MRIRWMLLLTVLALTACDSWDCIHLHCVNGFSWKAPLPEGWTVEEVWGGRVRMCINGGCEDRPFGVERGLVGWMDEESDGSVSIGVNWHVDTEITPLVDGDRVSLTLFAEDGSTIMGIAETPVTYYVVTGICDVGTCASVDFRGSTL